MPCQRCNLPFNSRHKSPGRGIKDFLEYIWRKLASHIRMTVCYLQQEKIQVLHFLRSIQWHKRLLFLIIASILYIYIHHFYNISSKLKDHIILIITREYSEQAPNGVSNIKRLKIISLAWHNAKLKIQSNKYTFLTSLWGSTLREAVL